MTRRFSRSLRNTDSYRRFVLDQLEGLQVTARSMFGGAGLYCGDDFFGIIASDVLYFKVDVSTRPAYEKAGMKPFKPYADRPTTMKYYAVPLSVVESSVELERWARAAIRVARRAKGS